MKKPFLLFAFLLFLLQASAQVVDKETAQQKAIQFMNEHRPCSFKGSTKTEVVLAPIVEAVHSHEKSQVNPEVTPSMQPEKATPYYVFNAVDGHGYVIVSGDERAHEILGYSDFGSLTEETMPCGLKMLLDIYSEEIKTLSQDGESKQATKAPAKKSKDRKDITPMVTCEWGQGSPYNLECPRSGGSRCITGCSATAMSQILYYWGKTRGYNIKASSIPSYVTRTLKLSLDELPATTFDWNSMENTCTTGISGQAASKLCRYVGQGLEMDYGVNGSEAWGTDMANVYRDYFGIDPHVRLAFRQDYNYEEWDEMIYNELAAGRPVNFGGSYINSSGTSWSGHGFLCDGYQASTGKYHINFGWNGQSNGYYELSALGSGTSIFNICLRLILGIQPPVDGHEYQKEEERAAIVDMSLAGARSFSRDNREQYFKGITVFNSVYNHLQYNTELVAGLGLYDESDKLIEVMAEAPLGRFDRYDGFGLEFTFGNLSLGKGLKGGTYYIRSISRSPSEDTWRQSANAEHNYITATITETELTLQPSVDLAISNVKSGGSWYSSSCTATITNNGTEESRGLLYAFSSSKLLNVVQTDLAPGEAKTVTLASGSVVKVTSDFDGHHVLWTNSSSVPNIALTACAVNADKNGCFEGQTLVLDVSVTNNSSTSTYGSQVSVKLCKEGSTAAVDTKTFTPQVEPLGIQTERFKFDGLTYNQPYTITLSSGSYTVEIGNMTTSQPRTFFVYTVTPVERTILPGDANLDGEVTIADVTAVVNRILSKEMETFSEENADVNGDGTITIADVTALVNIILGK